LSTTALAFALGAAALHALWNLVLAGADDSRAAGAAALAVGVVAWAPVALVGGEVHAAAAPYVVASAALEIAYFVALSAAYGRGALSAVYPVARGAAPVLVLGAALAGLGGAVGAAQVAGILLVGAGIVAVRGGGTDRGIPLALAVAVCIAGYTVIDRYGLRHADPLPYLWLVIAPSALATVGTTAPARLRAQLGPRTAFAGVAMFGAYGLVLAALRHAPAAPVAAVRETSIVLAVALGAVVLHEPVGRARWIGGAVVTAGTALVALG
jgi:drug/metabolite transporter (DMT)-like permease